MDLKEIREKKAAMEKAIGNLLAGFENETGLLAKDVQVSSRRNHIKDGGGVLPIDVLVGVILV